MMMVTVLMFIFACTFATANVTEQFLEVSNRISVDPQHVPYYVLLQIIGCNTKEPFYSSGTIISDEFVLSSADVPTAPKALQIVVGINTNLNNEAYQKKIEVASVTIHPQFNSELRANDIAVLRLSQRLYFNYGVRSIDLPTREISTFSFRRIEVLVTSKTYVKRSAFLRSMCICRFFMSKIYSINENQLCVGTKEVSIEQDRGAPLVHKEQLIGALSFYSEKYAVYTNVLHYIEWIREVMTSKQ